LIHIERILRWFELASRLQGNFYKSSLVGINLDDDFTTVWLIQSTVKREYQVITHSFRSQPQKNINLATSDLMDPCKARIMERKVSNKIK